MVNTPTFVKPFYRVVLDIVGPLPLTKHKNMFVLDLASRLPLRETSSKTVVEALLHIFTHLTVPIEILTDRGSNFVSNFMKEVY